MPKSVRRGGRRNKDARAAHDERGLLERILHTSDVAQIVRRLQPEVLHRVIQTCGLEDCGDLVAMATSDQLQRVFDLDLWRSSRPGHDEQLDPRRFAVWIEVLMEYGADVAAQKLAGIDPDLVAAALAQHVRVFDRAAVSPISIDGAENGGEASRRDGLDCDIGGHVVRAKRIEAWDSLVGLLLVLDAEHPDYFHRVMRGCRKLSNSGYEVDGLDDLLTDGEQHMFDLTVARDERREKQGYVTPAQARAFLRSARQLRLADAGAPAPCPIARAYFRAIEWTPPPDADAHFVAVLDELCGAGVLPQQRPALLEGPPDDAPRLARIQAHMEFARDVDEAAYSTRTSELAYLANTLVAGCSIQARPFTAREASDAVAAICSLGLENWPMQWRGENAGTALGENFLVDQDLISVFQVGWTVLYQEVCMYAAKQLISVVTDLQTRDRDVQAGLNALRFEMTRHWRAGAPWHARAALDVIMLDQPAWAALLGLIDECPVLHAAIGAARDSSTRTVQASAFEFISENRQIVSIREFMESLPETLRG